MYYEPTSQIALEQCSNTVFQTHTCMHSINPISLQAHDSDTSPNETSAYPKELHSHQIWKGFSLSAASKQNKKHVL